MFRVRLKSLQKLSSTGSSPYTLFNTLEDHESLPIFDRLHSIIKYMKILHNGDIIKGKDKNIFLIFYL